MLRKLALASALVASSILMVAAPLAAAADDTTKIAFVTAGPTTVEYGGEWSIAVKLFVSYSGAAVPLKPTDGTVDVFVDGVGGPFEKNLPILDGGFVYVSQPDSLPLLGAGDHTLRAVFNPATGSYLTSSQTKQKATLTVTPLAVEPSIAVDVTGAVPRITTSIAGAYVDARGGAPAGTWTFDVADSSGASLFSLQAAQPGGTKDPVVVDVTAKLKQGATYTVNATFEPAGDLGSGLTVATIPAQTVTTPGSTFAEIIGASVPLPLWLFIVLVLLAAGLAVVVIILASKMAGTRPQRAVAFAGADDVELMSLDEVGLSSIDTMPVATGAPWLLSDLDPAVGAPTVALPKVASADAPTELITNEQLSNVQAPAGTAEVPVPEVPAAEVPAQETPVTSTPNAANASPASELSRD